MSGSSFIKETNLIAFFCKCKHSINKKDSIVFTSEGYSGANAVDFVLVNVNGMDVIDDIGWHSGVDTVLLAADGHCGEHCEECHEFDCFIVHFQLFLVGFDLSLR